MRKAVTGGVGAVALMIIAIFTAPVALAQIRERAVPPPIDFGALQAPAGQIGGKGVQLIGRRNAVMPDQEGDLLECQGLRNIMDIVAAKGKLGDRPVDVGNTRLAGQYTLEPGNHLLGCLAHNAPPYACRWLACALCCAVRGDSCRFLSWCQGQETTVSASPMERDVHIASTSGVKYLDRNTCMVFPGSASVSPALFS